ncbi:hypothetical protein K503DRAFT_686422 [Rhizopogon vinicolor AM-OR11-026]|uniref:Uncharacterized protein n=1 Tax=Rhizopogon vinicolor AM-OR11-026 TaxID=1314800 RepID=A0A1B7N814_9AGAM|nr:hypothetical protein K503DRAFT_686422 [Rhizopogon vinicolor AM-OR11-026]
MIPHLESIHVDVLSQIAFFTVASTPFDGLGTILQLLLCSRKIYNTLSLKSCPQLYARVFRTRFDLVAHLRRSKLSSRTTTALASEFHRRCMVLQRIRRFQVPQHSILPDLWTIYLMLLESDGMNESQLHAAGIAQYVLMLFKCHLGQPGGLHDNTARALTISIACLVWSHKFIIHLPAEERGQMLSELRPFVTGSINVPSPHVHNRTTRRCPSNGSSNRAVGACIPNKHRALVSSFYGREHTLTAPSLLSVSIFLTFALKEATALQVPKHLPPTQAIARATERHGPTMEDFLIITRRRTPLLADSVYQSSFRECFADRAGRKIRASRSIAHDEEFYRIARRLDFPENTWELRACIGLLSGTWEGTYMTSPSSFCQCPSQKSDPAFSPDFVCRQPIQCRLEEHLCFSPCVPLPSVSQDGDFGQSAFQHLYMNGCEGAAKANEFSYATGASKHRYELFRPSDTSENDRDPRQALDVVITGETPRMLDAAWGAYIFFGRIRLSDGLVTLTRKPKYSGDEGRGTWIFEGYIHGRRSFVGRWRSFGACKNESLRGIFSLTKVEEPPSHLY